MMRLIPFLYARLLRLYPAMFRDRFAEEMQYVFEQAWMTAHQRGFWSVIVFCVRECLGLFLSILHSHLVESRGRVFSRLIFNPRIAIPVLALIGAVPAAMFSLDQWGYLFAPPPADRMVSSFEQIHSLHFVQYEADYHARVISTDHLPLASVTDYPPARILPLLQGHVDPASVSAPLEQDFLAQLADVLRAEQIQLSKALSDREIHFCIARTTRCFTDFADLPPDVLYGYQPGIRFLDDGSILRTMPVLNTVSGKPISGKIDEAILTPRDGWGYFNYFMPSGFVIQGIAQDGTRLVLVNLATRLSGDHYGYHELLFEVNDGGLQKLTETAYQFDVAGIEGVTFPIMMLVYLIPLILLWFLLMLIWRLVLLITNSRAERRDFV